MSTESGQLQPEMLVSGEGFNCARSERGRGFCWGFHARGALGTGATSMNVPVPVRFGE